MNAEQRAAVEIADRYYLVSRWDDESETSVWYVPDGRDSGERHTVTLDPASCTCETYARREGRTGWDRDCRHLLAVLIDNARNCDVALLDELPFVVSDTRPKRRRTAADGSSMEPLPLPTTAERRLSKHARYRAAEAASERHLPRLLYELCRYVPDWEVTQGGGRPPVPLSDIVFCVIYRVAVQKSSRDLPPHLEAARAAGYITTAPYPNIVLKYTREPEVWPYLERLIVQTAVQFRDIDDRFAIDSSVFHTGRLLPLKPDAKSKKRKKDRVKLHAVCGLRSGAFTAVEVSKRAGKRSHDGNFLIPLVKQTTERFTEVAMVAADGSYAWDENFEYLEGIGAAPYVAFRDDATGEGGESYRKWFDVWKADPGRGEWGQKRRKGIESMFKSVKNKFGRTVRAKTFEAATGEVLSKVVCHNIRRVVHGAYRFGIKPDFWPDTSGN